MAQITGQAASQLRNQLLAYLEQNSPNLSSEEITNVLNEYLSGGDKVTAQGGGITNGIYKRFLEFDKITNKVEVVTTGLWSGDTGSLTSFFSQSTTNHQLVLSFEKLQSSNNEYITHNPEKIYLSKEQVQEIAKGFDSGYIKSFLEKRTKKQSIEDTFKEFKQMVG